MEDFKWHHSLSITAIIIGVLVFFAFAGWSHDSIIKEQEKTKQMEIQLEMKKRGF